MTAKFPEIGKCFEEKYRIEALLGSGGFARVYLAEQTDLGRKVAIKVLSLRVPRALMDTEALDPQVESVAIRFEREARIVSQLRSPQTITIYDYGRTPDGLLYMVMEYIDGVELAEVPLPIEPRRAIKILSQVLQSLREAHAHGLLHRDLKPANIMVFTHLGQKDQVKLLDFGIAKAIGQVTHDAGADLTSADSLIGTPRYMAPEQIRGKDIGPAADIYSLGLVVYELLMGEKAITNSDSIEILGKHLSAESFEIPPGHPIHPQLSRVVNKMLAKDLSQRYASTEEVLADLAELDRIDGDLRIGGPPPPAVVSSEHEIEALDDSFIETLDVDFPATMDETDPRFPGFEDKPDRARKRTAALVLVALLMVAAVGVAMWPRAEAPPAYEAVSDTAPVADAPAQAAARDDAPKPAPIITLIRTRPSGASIWLDERLMGMSPVQFNADAHSFPLTVRAKLGEQSVEKILAKPGGEIWLEISSPEQNRDEAQSERMVSARKGAKPAARPKSVPKAPPASAPKPATPRVKTVAKKPANTPAPKTIKPQKQEAEPPKKSEVNTRKYLPLD